MTQNKIQSQKVKPSHKLVTEKGHFDEYTELASELLEFLDDREAASMSGLSIEQIEKIRKEKIK